MFGQPDDNQLAAAQPAQNPSMLDNVSTQDLQGQAAPDPAAAPADPQAQTQPQPVTDPAAQHPLTTDNPFVPTPSVDPAAPASVGQAVTSPDPALSAPSQPAPAPVYQQQADDNAADSPTPTTSASDSPLDHAKLADMKQEAMSQLEPLVDHIDGSPEETFKTTMMMIQASDNHSLLDKALAAAKTIEDDKVRAEALLDIINEINYFTQKDSAS